MILKLWIKVSRSLEERRCDRINSSCAPHVWSRPREQPLLAKNRNKLCQNQLLLFSQAPRVRFQNHRHPECTSPGTHTLNRAAASNLSPTAQHWAESRGHKLLLQAINNYSLQNPGERHFLPLCNNRLKNETLDNTQESLFQSNFSYLGSRHKRGVLYNPVCVQ